MRAFNYAVPEYNERNRRYIMPIIRNLRAPPEPKREKPPRDPQCPDLCDSGIMALLLAHTARIFILYICSPWHNVPLYIVCMLLEWRLLRSETGHLPEGHTRETPLNFGWMDRAQGGGSSHWEKIYEYEFVVLTTDCMSVLYRPPRALLSWDFKSCHFEFYLNWKHRRCFTCGLYVFLSSPSIIDSFSSLFLIITRKCSVPTYHNITNQFKFAFRWNFVGKWVPIFIRLLKSHLFF